MSTPREPLSEKDFIHQGVKQNPYPFWLWLFLLAVFIILGLGASSWYNGKMSSLFRTSPFLQVTNRELSLFLWQNPEYMRAHAQEKTGYLPGFHSLDGVSMDLAASDQYVEAPPTLLFLYHTWRRLVSQEFTSRAIPKEEFKQFLNDEQEWLPRYWPNAPQTYAESLSQLPELHLDDLSALSSEQLPKDVRIAFQGWKNFYKEGKAINNVKPTVKQMQEFLAASPHYARNYWRNIVETQFPHYLIALQNPADAQAPLPEDQLPPFLKVAFYNYLMAGK